MPLWRLRNGANPTGSYTPGGEGRPNGRTNPRTRVVRTTCDVACELRGPVVGDLMAHLALRWYGVTDETLEVVWPDAAGHVEAQVVSTIPERR